MWFAGSCKTKWSRFKIHFWSNSIFQIHVLNMNIIAQVSKPTMLSLENSIFVCKWLSRITVLSCHTEVGVDGWWDPGPHGALGELRTLRATWRFRGKVQVCNLRCKLLKMSFSAGDSDLSPRLQGNKYFSRNSSRCLCDAAHYFLFVDCAPLGILRHSKSLHASSISTGPVGMQW